MRTLNPCIFAAARTYSFAASLSEVNDMSARWSLIARQFNFSL
jgi:hypothetical protein